MPNHIRAVGTEMISRGAWVWEEGGVKCLTYMMP
jgi:hypothetical protein